MTTLTTKPTRAPSPDMLEGWYLLDRSLENRPGVCWTTFLGNSFPDNLKTQDDEEVRYWNGAEWN